jgi:hypothetical protein
MSRGDWPVQDLLPRLLPAFSMKSVLNLLAYSLHPQVGFCFGIRDAKGLYSATPELLQLLPQCVLAAGPSPSQKPNPFPNL